MCHKTRIEFYGQQMRMSISGKRRKKIEDLLALRGKISIDYEWEREEEAELKAAEERECLGA